MKGPITLGGLACAIGYFMGKSAVTPGEELSALLGIGGGLALIVFGIARAALRGARWAQEGR